MDIIFLVIPILLLTYLIKFVIFPVKYLLKKREMKERPQWFFLQNKALCIDESDNDAKLLHEVSDPIEPILEFWNDSSAQEFPCFVGDSLNTKVKRSKENLKKMVLEGSLS